MENALVIEIRVRPHAKRNAVSGVVGDPPRLVVAVQAPAVDGKANQAVIREIADAFDVRARDVTILFGELHRDKRISIAGDLATLEARAQELKGTLEL